jgi:uncharacterized membrane protein
MESRAAFKPLVIWSYLRASFWFVPSLMVLGSILLALSLIGIDTAGDDGWLDRWPRLFGAQAEGARSMVSTIATAMMSVIGVTFSVTLVALALASSQFSSRVLRNFMSSHITQVALGTFAGTFTYCLIVLRTIRDGEADSFVPSLSVFFAFVFAILCIAVLIVFIHHIASSIQATNIIASVTRETLHAMERMFPAEGDGEEDGKNEGDARSDPTTQIWQPITATRSGYVQTVNLESLLRLAAEHNLVVRMERCTGEFVLENTPLATVAGSAPVGQDVVSALCGAFSVSHHRTIEQDPSFGVRQLVDVALKALSPGINDPTTAETCVQYLTTILARLAPRKMPPQRRYCEGVMRLIVRQPDFGELLFEAFDQVRDSAAGNPTIIRSLFEALQRLTCVTVDSDRRRALRDHARWLAELVDRTIKAPHESAALKTSLVTLQASLGTDSDRERTCLLP